ncbi:MAG: aldo/keto reductase [Bacillota bacterium]|nr:aldo/keto reductase [Bacillota bacterium]
MNIKTTVLLNNGVKMPILGIGVYLAGENTESAVTCALRTGYRLIDTAATYGNEKQVGNAVRNSGIPRDEIFITTKLWNEDMRNGTQRKAYRESLRLLDVDYIDLYLIHWPVADKYKDTWKIMEDLYSEGKIRAIGVSNFEIHHLENILSDATVIPAVNQIEFNPLNTRKDLIEYCRKKGIVCEAWSPFRRGVMLKHELIEEISKKYNKSSAQVILRWDLQHQIITIPMAVEPCFIEENSQIFDFSLTDEEMKMIDACNENLYMADPNHVTW